MKNRIITWEVIAAGCAFIVLSAYLFDSTTAPAGTQQVKQIHIEIPHVPKVPHVPDAVAIDLKKMEKMELEKAEELKQLEIELQKVEKELEEISIELDMPSLSTIKGLPRILIHSR